MENTKPLEILKMAILMEKRGYAFYTTVAGQTEDPGIRNIFMVMADEESRHIKFLSDQYLHYEKQHAFEKVALPDLSLEGFASLILSEEMKERISASGYEAAAISAAMEFENRAIELYSRQAGTTSDPYEKALYSWLAEWEKGHLRILSEIDNELKEKIWNDNNFWPF